jgi:predicted nucleic acid-binding protein
VKGAFVFDSHALLKLFQREKGWEKVGGLLEEIHRSGQPKYINVMNVGEIIYATKREFGDQKKIEVLANIERLDFTILPATDETVYHAAELKAQYSISFADCFTLASALDLNATIVTGDPEFKKVENIVSVNWV